MAEEPKAHGPDRTRAGRAAPAAPGSAAEATPAAPATPLSDGASQTRPATPLGNAPTAPEPAHHAREEESPYADAPRWGHLSLIEPIGRGGYGRVFRAWDPALAREVALKLVRVPRPDPASVTAMLREGRLLARVRHANVVTVHGAQQVGDEIGLWMELVRGRSLAEIVVQDGPMGAEEAAVVGVSVCRALAAVHAEGLVHRDVKAQNVMREAGGRIVLMDFGTGRDLGRERHFDPAGTPAYMAPEVLLGKTATQASDLYSVGVVLFYLVTGVFPADGRSMADLVVAHGSGRRRLLTDCRPDLPERFVRIVERAIEPNPEERYQTAGAMLRDLTDVAPLSSPGLTPGATPLRLPPAGPLPPQRSVPHHTPRRLLPSRGEGRATPRRTREPRSAFVAAALVSSAVVGGLVAMGWLTSTAFNTTLGRTAPFADETVLDHLRWGLKSLVAPAFYMAVFVAPFAVAAMAWRLAGSFSERGHTWSEHLTGRVTALFRRPEAVQAIAVLVVGLQAAALAVLAWRFAPVLVAATSFVSTDAPELFAPLHAGAGAIRLWYRPALSATVIASVMAWAWLIARGGVPAQPGGRVALAAGAVLLLCAVAMLTAPYRLLSHAEFERVTYGGVRCYVLGATQQDALLHCPEARPPRNRVVRTADPRLSIEEVKVIESVFTPVAGPPAVP